MNESTFCVLMKDVCAEMDIKVDVLSYGWIMQLSKGNKIRHVTGRRFDLNPEATGEIACDKYATFEVLKSQNVPVIEHVMIFNPATRASLIGDEGISPIIMKAFLKYGCVVVKPNNGCEGHGVMLCNSLRETETAIQKIFKKQNSASICPYYNIKTEYRTFYLDGEVYLIYGKTKPYVIGDGQSTLVELISKLNLPDKSIVQENLKQIDLDYVPKNNEKVDVSWKHNLSGGAEPEILAEGELYDKIKELSISAGRAMNINFATIDIVETVEGNLYVLEVNSGIGATIFVETVEGGYEIIRNIYKKAIGKMFQ